MEVNSGHPRLQRRSDALGMCRQVVPCDGPASEITSSRNIFITFRSKQHLCVTQTAQHASEQAREGGTYNRERKRKKSTPSLDCVGREIQESFQIKVTSYKHKAGVLLQRSIRASCTTAVQYIVPSARYPTNLACEIHVVGTRKRCGGLVRAAHVLNHIGSNGELDGSNPGRPASVAARQRRPAQDTNHVKTAAA